MAHRLRKPAEFARVLAAPPADALRASEGCMTMKAVYRAVEAGGVRLGITVGKRHARRAVDRSLVKRAVRESFRAARPALDAALGGRALDVSVRLSAPLPTTRPAAAVAVGARQLRRTVRSDADRLFADLRLRLTARAAAHADRA